MSYEWINASINTPLPKYAVLVGKDKDGSNLYIGQCKINDAVVAVKINPSWKQAFVAYDGIEKKVTNFNVLVKTNEEEPEIWAHSATLNSKVFANAVECGHDSNNNKYYVGKTFHRGFCVPGYINSVTKAIHIPFGHKEHKYYVYEILMKQYQ